MKDINVSPDTINLLEENIGRTLYDINHSKILFGLPPREMEIKTKINKWDLMKLKSFCTAKETRNKTKRQPSENICKWSNWQWTNLQNLQAALSAQYQKANNLIQKWAENLNRHISKADIQTANKHMKECSTSLIIREMQIQSTVRYLLTPVRMAIIKKSRNSKCWRGCGEKGTLLHCWWECKLIQPLWRTVWRFLKKKKN